MAMKKMTGAKKPAAKMVTKAKPKTPVTKSRGSKTAKQIGDMNQRERYNQDREKNTKIQLSNRAFGNSSKATAAEKKAYGKDMGRPSASGSGGKLTAADVKTSQKKYKYSEATGARKSQRAGGKGK